MINVQRIEAMLRSRYPDLENVGNGVFRGVDRFGTRDYAIRYFDLNDRVATTAPSLKRYQEEVLSQNYFSTQVATDLRWSHYLYFITSDEQATRGGFGRAKATIEADREYARKQVVREDDVPALIAKARPPSTASALPVDLATIWSQTLEQHGLGFILDDDLSVPDAVRRILAASKDKAARPVSPMALLPAEQAAASHFLNRLTITGFRPHPEQKTHPLGRVNLIVGSNGVGKTSLLEAIEFGYCGRNRRSSAVLNGTSIALEFLGTTETLSSTTDATRLRARHANWYAKTELKKVSVHESFGKFNFLDTDAAVNLSVSGSSDQIGADVTRLILGAAAENLADRLRRVLDQLKEELRALRRDNVADMKSKEDAQARLDGIRAAPHLSDSLFLELLAALKPLGWLKPPEEKGHISNLRDCFQEAVSAIELLRHSSINVLHTDPDGAVHMLANLIEEAGKATALNEQAKAATLKHYNAQRVAKAAVERVATIEALLPYASIDFARLAAEARDRQSDVRARTAKIALVATNSVTASAVEPLLSQRVTEAISTVEQQIETHQRSMTTAQSSLQALEKTQSSLTVLRQRLLSTAQDILQRTPNPDHCPLCHTEFESGQLLARITTDFEGDASSQAGRLQTEIASASEALASAHTALAALQPIGTFLAERAHTVTVGAALQYIDQEKVQLERERSGSDSAHSQIQQLQAEGLSSQALSSGLLAAGLAELPSLEALQRLQTEQTEAVEMSQNVAETALKELDDVRKECEALAARLSIESPDSTEMLVNVVRKRVTDVEAALGARHLLTSLLTIGADTTVDELAINLLSSQRMLAQVATAIAQEETNNAALDRAAKAVGDLTTAIESSNTKIGYVVEAEQVLETLAKQSSGGELTNHILAENAQEIARTFASIHMPNEFELKADNGKLVIVRRVTGAEVQLDQMSTGQRAAFALSLFLAMNGRLRSGPPILLFDDPVAHIDDINVLSFLDHLRHLVINGSRQIFFATADTKLAGLFRHKFRFLDEDFKELVLSRS